MKYYKNNNDYIYAYKDNINQELLDYRIEKLGLTEITEEELKAIQAQKDLDNQVAEKTEISELQSYLNDSNYIAINYGALRTEAKKDFFLASVSDTYNMTNEEVLDKRDEAIARINTLRASLSS